MALKSFVFIFALLLMNAFAARQSHEELTLYVHTSGNVYTQTLIGKGDANNLTNSGMSLSVSRQLNADGSGVVNVELLNRSGWDMDEVRLFVFSDDAIDENSNGFANEYGYMQSVEMNMTGLIAPTYWQIDEPDYLEGRIVSNLKKGTLEQISHIDAARPDDASLALGFDIGTFERMHLIAFRIHYGTDAGRLVQVDAETNASLHFDVLVNAPRPAGLPPVAVDDNVTLQAHGTAILDILSNDTDPENDIDATSVHLVSLQAIDGDGDGDANFLEVAGEGNWSVLSDGNLTFFPSAELAGDPGPVAYRVSDAYGFVSNTATVQLHYPEVSDNYACTFQGGLNVFDAAGAIRLGSCQTELHRHGDTLLNVSENKLYVQGNCYSHCDGNRCEGSGVFAQRLELPPFEGGVKSTGSQTIKNEGDEIVAGRNKITVQTNGRFDVAVDNALMHEINSLVIRNNSDFRFNYSGDVPYKIKTLKLQSGNAHTITFEPGTYFIEKFTHQAGTNLAVDGTGDGSGTVRLYVKNGIKLNGGHSNVNFDDALASKYDQDAGALLIVSYAGDINIQAGVDIAALIYAEEGDISIKASPLTFSGAATANNITLQNSVTYWEAGIEGECPNE